MPSYRSAFFAIAFLATVLAIANGQKVDDLVLAPMDPNYAAGFPGESQQQQQMVQHYDPGSGNPHPKSKQEAPVEKKLATEAPATKAPATEAPATEAPATEAPAAETPATGAPATVAPATEAPATVAPATEAPATVAPATQAPATVAPGTEAPATVAPASEAPVTIAAVTEAPITGAPVTETPIVGEPATAAPETQPKVVGGKVGQCRCPHGTPMTVYGCTENEERCIACDDGFFLDQVYMRCEPVLGHAQVLETKPYVDPTRQVHWPSEPAKDYDPTVKRKECELTSQPSNETVKAQMASQEAWRVHERCMSKLGLTHKELGEQVLAMGKLLHTVRHDLEGEESMENEAAIEAKIATQQEKVESDTTNITVSFKEQKQYCLRFELFAKRTDNNLKESIRKDKLYCKERAAKAKLCRVDNEKNFALVKKRRARARLRVKEILTASMKASKFAMNNEADSANRKVDELVVKRVEQSLLAHEAAIAALKYLEYTETIYLRRQGRKDLVSKNPDKVCFSEDIVLNSTLELTELQGEMKAKNEQAVRAAAGVKCTRDNLKLVERGSKVPPCTAFRGDTAVKLWYDASKTKEATAKMNAVIVNAAILSAAANRTLFEELGSSKKDAMAIADAEEISRCKSHAVAVANALVKDQNAHNVRDEAFDRGDLCHADVRTVFIEFMAANRHRAGNPSRGKRLSAMLRLHANEQSRRRALLADAGWKSMVKEFEGANGNKDYSVSCDTKFKCKAKFIADAQKKSSEREQCVVCTDQLYTEGFASYGADKDTEKSVFGRYNSPMETVVGRWDFEMGYVNRLNRKDPPAPKDAAKCLDKASDSFELPCCRPYRYPSGSLVVVDPKDAASVMKIGPITNFDKNVKCCGGGPACCRWCPEKICDSLEKVPENLPKLWFHVCSGEDTKPSWASLGKESR